MNDEIITLVTDSVVSIFEAKALESLYGCLELFFVILAVFCGYLFIKFMVKQNNKDNEENDRRWASRIAEAIEVSRRSSSTED